MDTEALPTVSDNDEDLRFEMDALKLNELLKDIETKITALKISDSDSSESADVSLNHSTALSGTIKKRCWLTQQAVPSWRRSGRRWQPISVFKSNKAPVQSLRETSSPSSSSSNTESSELTERVKKRCWLTQKTNPSWRRSGRRWQPTSIFKRDKTPPRRRPPSSSDSESCERPAVRGRSRVRRPPKISKKRSLIMAAVKILLSGKDLEFGDFQNLHVMNSNTVSCERPVGRKRSGVWRSPKLSE